MTIIDLNRHPHPGQDIGLSLDPSADIDLPFPPDPSWTAEIGWIEATLPAVGQWQHHGTISAEIGASQRGVNIGIYQITLETAIDLIALLADAIQEHYRQQHLNQENPSC